MKASHYLACIGAMSFAAFSAVAQTPPAKVQTQPTKQDAAKEEMPPGWKMRLDGEAAGHDMAAGHSGAEHAAKHEEHMKANTAPPRFWTMPPGWHITSGPAAIYYDPAQTAGGKFRLESETFLFPPGDRNEGYGFFFGGKDLHSEKITYTYFLIRRDGSFLVKQRRGGQTKELAPWTAHAAIVKHDATTKTTAKNQLAIEAGAQAIEFFVNGQKVHSLPRAQANPEGHVGLRINHAINAHITYLTITLR